MLERQVIFRPKSVSKKQNLIQAEQNKIVAYFSILLPDYNKQYLITAFQIRF
jgi:hypothetical protein